MTQQEMHEINKQKIIAGLKLALERLLVYKKQKKQPHGNHACWQSCGNIS
jgi:hypothetical protein